jgi:hypothetical protein
MGVEIRPVFQPRISGLLYEAEGKAIADALRRIHTFSTKRGLRSITEFLADEDDATAGWYSAADGLQAVRQLAEAIRADPKAEQRWNKEDPDGLETLLDDLDDLVRCLEKAAAKDAKFRLEVG